METLSRRGLGLLFVLLAWLPPDLYCADVGSDLEGIKRKIESERKGISQVQRREGSILQSLGKIQGDLEKKTKELKLASASLATIIAAMEKIESEVEDLSVSVAERRELLKKRVSALYRWHRGASLFVIFNGDMSLGAFLQRKRYLEATVAFDQDLVRQLDEEIQHQETLRRDLAEKREELDRRRNALTRIKESVNREAEKKRALLASLRREKESRIQVLKELEQAAIRLEKMMQEISRRAVRKPAEPPSGIGLAALRGKLEWPVKGAITSPFGKAKHREFTAEVFRKGIAIEAPAGEEIKVVERGRVVFADHFAGYGKMVIVDHGERYFTIYAHLSEILTKIGSEVKRGDILGLVGDSDSLAGVKLYFEMRKDGRSIDPLPWFRAP
jgi:septal ring factor EnvC (AmiA/AmiB activator)